MVSQISSTQGSAFDAYVSGIPQDARAAQKLNSTRDLRNLLLQRRDGLIAHDGQAGLVAVRQAIL